MFEIDMEPSGYWAKKVKELHSQGKDYNLEDAPKPLSLLLPVDFKRKFKSPIIEEDSVYINFSYSKESIQENTFNKEEVNKMNSAVSNTDVESLKTDKISVEKEAKGISKLLQECKISPEEAMKKVESLTKPMLDKLDNSSIMN